MTLELIEKLQAEHDRSAWNARRVILLEEQRGIEAQRHRDRLHAMRPPQSRANCSRRWNRSHGGRGISSSCSKCGSLASMVDAAIEAAKLSPCQSKRGAAIWDKYGFCVAGSLN